jgi:hypothetical protein
MENLSTRELEERRRMGLVRFSLAMEDMSRLVGSAGLAAHGSDDEEDEVTESARHRAMEQARALRAAGSKEDIEERGSEKHRASSIRPSFGEDFN